eukprot:CAMPEP_0113820252 /NCGR_PEP_ID=MMETSP0328-20130328/1147_1 /TAXON_ID=39455 /ORGANISM="Alexandrium minutum" /LENGTH=191 /DNA_ID=CAMNT_0000788187 /DNA_START=196 /DNA_END=768 /DNA_ORIENTATION=- /assembly_acc=CAM_ASM_000350
MAEYVHEEVVHEVLAILVDAVVGAPTLLEEEVPQRVKVFDASVPRSTLKLRGLVLATLPCTDTFCIALHTHCGSALEVEHQCEVRTPSLHRAFLMNTPCEECPSIVEELHHALQWIHLLTELGHKHDHPHKGAELVAKVLKGTDVPCDTFFFPEDMGVDVKLEVWGGADKVFSEMLLRAWVGSGLSQNGYG